MESSAGAVGRGTEHGWACARVGARVPARAGGAKVHGEPAGKARWQRQTGGPWRRCVEQSGGEPGRGRVGHSDA